MYTTLIAAQELAAHVDDKNWIVLDCRHDLMDHAAGRKAYDAGHLPHAQFADMEHAVSGEKRGADGVFRGRHPLPDMDAFVAQLRAWGVDDDTQVVAYDGHGGMFAARVWWMLRWLGHDAVAVLDGGYAKWTAESRPVSTDVPSVEPARFEVSRVMPTVSATGIAASLPRHTLLLIDARAAERFRGDVEPLDPVAGHIPGAMNRPYARNVKADGTFRPPRELRGEFEAMLHGRPVEDVVHYCGSGVSAAHNVLAMAVAGYPLTRLYPGSWSEWVSSRARPIATGGV
jgi:thiosulfate/3-mercaptopyruvate sulfurtransferase